jgi:hypothetical protein
MNLAIVGLAITSVACEPEGESERAGAAPFAVVSETGSTSTSLTVLEAGASASPASTAPPLTTTSTPPTSMLPPPVATPAPTLPPVTSPPVTAPPVTAAPATAPPRTWPPVTQPPPVVQPAASGCDPNYSGACVPIASDVDCAGGSGNGPAYVAGPVTVIGSDIYDLDRDGDGVGCV